MRALAVLSSLLCGAALAAQPPAAKAPAKTPAKTVDEPPPLPEALRELDAWRESYLAGAFRLTKDGADDPQALAEVGRLLAAAAQQDDLRAAQAVLAAAAVTPELPGALDSAEQVTFLRELQPWAVHALAVQHLARMTCAGLDDWLVARLGDALRDPARSREAETAAVLRAIGARGGRGPGLAMLLQASCALPKEQRAKAVHALSQIATAETVDHFVGLLRDVEPNVRIAALNALGHVLAPLTDETAHEQIAAEVAAMRDRVIAAMQGAVVRDPIWQVRAAAAENLARLRSKLAIPALIAGLEAELSRKRDPWALDLRLHRLLEGLTGQQMLPNQVSAWERFWRAEGDAFALTTSRELVAAKAHRAERGDTQSRRFFLLDIESDRLLFVLDFSGSMLEPAGLRAASSTGVAAAAAAADMTKAQLVMQELERLVTSLPDGTLFNLIVFSEDVRAWRTDASGRPTLVRLDDAARDDLLGSYLRRLQPGGATNLWGALRLALDLEGRGLYDKHYAVGFDTLYVMSDGAPTWGELTDTTEILRRVREANALRRLAIHAVTFGDKNEMRFMQTLAQENGGRHLHVE